MELACLVGMCVCACVSSFTSGATVSGKQMSIDEHLCGAQTDSKFFKAYAAGLHKSKYWEPFYEDTMDLIAKLPELAALVRMGIGLRA